MVRSQRLFVICIFSSIFLCGNDLPSQSIPRAQITGSVIDGSTGEPLHFANVFLSSTTLGDATDEEGHFEIENVPFGHY